MAIIKNALIRYKTLDNCFRNPGKKYFIEDLIAECAKVLCEIDPDSNGISLRQIRADIAFMESSEGWGVELTKTRDGKRFFYRYADRNYSINNMPLNEVEINQLKSAVEILSQFKGMPEFEWIHELVPKLQQGMVYNEATSTIIEFDNNQYLKGIEYLGILYNAIFYKKVLSIRYKPFDYDNPFDITIHPYYLKQYNNRWFLFGYNQENQKYNWNMALDRIVEIKEIKGKYQKNNEIDWNEYFEDIIGVTKPIDEKLQKIKLHFYGKTCKYMESKPIHGSQKSKWIDGKTLEVNLDLIINYELERLILSYADDVKVLQPKKLVNIIEKRLTEAGKLY